ncbi:MAG: thiamine-phosphate kinase [Proteobacteria bacterium]|nr:thiamine-phosphate kinase [Pseudomonadota bacterium]
MTGESEIIERYFRQGFADGRGVRTGIGDDGAVLRAPDHADEIVVSCDTLIDGVHFPKQHGSRHAADLGYRCLAVNLSDLAAMGADPLWFTLALTMPSVDEDWLQAFSSGLRECAVEANIALVGGDTCRGPLACTIQVIGSVPQGQALLRSGAAAGDAIYVSGDLGAAAAWIRGLEHAEPAVDLAGLAARFWRPAAQLALGKALRKLASAAIDISDGLVRDLAHVLRASRLGAKLQLEDLPLCETLRKFADREQTVKMAAGAGDDYQLCFTIADDKQQELERLASELDIRLTRIGQTTEGEHIEIFYNDQPVSLDHTGFGHFAG